MPEGIGARGDRRGSCCSDFGRPHSRRPRFLRTGEPGSAAGLRTGSIFELVHPSGIPPDYELFPSRYGAVIAKDDLPRVSFTDEVNRESVEAVFLISDAGGNVVGRYIWEGRTLRFRPDEPFLPARRYRLRQLVQKLNQFRSPRFGVTAVSTAAGRFAWPAKPWNSGPGSPEARSLLQEYRRMNTDFRNVRTDGTPFPSSPSFSSAAGCSGGAGNAFSPPFGHLFSL